MLPQLSVGGQPLTRLRARVRTRILKTQFSHRQGRAEVKNRRCLNPACPSYGTVGSRSIIHNGFYRTRSGKRRRYRCGECGKASSSTKGYALLPSPTSKSYFRWGHRSQSRGCQHFLDFPDQRDCLEHRRPLAREGSPSVSSIQSQKDRWLRCQRASSRRDSHVRGCFHHQVLARPRNPFAC